jgi:hypothetical protein
VLHRICSIIAVATVVTAGALPAAGSTAPSGLPCSERALQKAIKAGGVVRFGENCDLQLKTTLTVAGGQPVTIDGSGYSVKLDGLAPDNTYSVRPLDVLQRELTLKNLTVVGGLVQTPAGTPGADGAPGADGQDPGAAGDPGNPGDNGQDAHGAVGGAMFISRGSTVVIDHVSFRGNTAIGGVGGAGGAGGVGGEGADSADTGGAAGPGGDGGAGGGGGNGGDALGGAIYNAGSLSITDSSFAKDLASAGAGGNGGLGGSGAAGGDVVCSNDPCNGDGGVGGRGGDSGAAGSGGRAAGAAIYSVGTLSLRHVTFDSEVAQGGAPGSGLVGGDGGAAGCNGDDCAAAGDGGSGGAGGNGGSGDGAAVVALGHSVTRNVTYLDDSVTAGAVGPGCPAAGNGCGGLGGQAGGVGGDPGSAGVDGTSGTAGEVNADLHKPGLPRLRVATRHLVAAHRHVHYYATVAASGGIAPYTFVFHHLPAGLHGTRHGVIRGKPRHAVHAHVRVRVRDPAAAFPTSALRKLTLRVGKH